MTDCGPRVRPGPEPELAGYRVSADKGKAPQRKLQGSFTTAGAADQQEVAPQSRTDWILLFSVS